MSRFGGHAESVQLDSRGQRPRYAIRAKYLTLKGSKPTLFGSNDYNGEQSFLKLNLTL
jgi:hypothetical protein